METERAYEVLGLTQGTSFREVMEAHRDLVEVWDPKRFHDNLRLQRRAVQELASINEAFDTLRLHALQERLPRTETNGPTVRSASVPPGRTSAIGVGSHYGGEIPRASLYDDALPKPRNRQRFLALLPLITGAILALVVIIWILTSDSAGDIDDQPSAPPASAAPAQSPEAPAGTQRTPSHTTLPPPQPALVPETETHGTAENHPTASADRAAPRVRQAFELLREKSRTASSLVENGRYDNLRFESWKPLRADLHECQLQLIAVREPDGDRVRLVWSVNLETRTVRPLNDTTRELQDRESGPKPRLIRQL